MNRAVAYVPEDRRHSLATGREPARMELGSVLFVDISGFTPLTEALVAYLGRRKGAGAATEQLNAIYTLLVDEIHRAGGTIVGFSGDGMLCWFSADRSTPADAAHRGLAAACAVQLRMAELATISIGPTKSIPLFAKTALTSGRTSRFLVGDPDIQRIDVLAGAVVDRAGVGEQLARQGEIILDRASVGLTRAVLDRLEVRTQDGGFAAVSVADCSALLTSVPSGEPTETLSPLPAESVATWLLPAVRRGLVIGQEAYLGELRPAVALFARFTGLDYDRDPNAPRKLDSYVRWVQSVLERNGGALIQLTTGDKGSYFYASFGAPVAHDDDVERAAASARTLLRPSPTLAYRPLPQMGLAAGRIRVGAYGSDSRCAYGVQGAAVNLAAQLMMHAEPGAICTDESTAALLHDRYAVDNVGTAAVKGGSPPRQVFVVGLRIDRPSVLHAAWFDLPLRGRNCELAQIESCWENVRATGKGTLLRVEGDPGIGKSHLIAEFLAQTKQPGTIVVGTACQAMEQNSAYSGARQIGRWLLGLGRLHNAAEKEQIAHVQHFLASVNPEWLPRLPLLGDLLGLTIEDNDLTVTFDARLRREALADLAIDITLTAAGERPLVMLVDDIQWIDEASLGLLQRLAHAAKRAPLLLIVTQRTQADAPANTSRMLDGLEDHVCISLAPIPDDVADFVVQDRLGGTVTRLAGALIQARAQGNPLMIDAVTDVLRETKQLFYSDEQHAWTLSAAILEKLRRAGLLDEMDDEVHLQGDVGALDLGVPDSVHGLVLAQLDRLSAEQKLVLKVAGVLGRTFSRALLAATHPLWSTAGQAAQDLPTLIEHGFLLHESNRPDELRFRHNVTQEVLYHTLLDEQRRDLHLRAGLAIESVSPDEVAALAHHFYNADVERQYVRAKSLRYLDLAAARTQRDYANETALHHVERALTLETTSPRLLRKIELLHLLGRRREENATLDQLARTPNRPDHDLAFARGTFFEATSRYDEATAAMELALTSAQQAQDTAREAAALARLGHIVWRRGDYATATAHYRNALLLLGRKANFADEEADARYGLGLVHRQHGQYDQAQAEFAQALEIYRKSGNRPNEAKALIAIGHVEHYRRNLAEAMAAYEAALPLYRSTGDKAGIGYSLFSLAQGHGSLGDHGRSRDMLLDALDIYDAQGDLWHQSLIWNELGIVCLMVGKWVEAEAALSNGLEISTQLRDQSGIAYLLCNLGQVRQGLGRYDEAIERLEEGRKIAEEHNDTHLQALCLQELALTNLHMKQYEKAYSLAQSSATKFERLGVEGPNIPNHTTRAAVYVIRGESELAHASIDAARESLRSDAGDDVTFPQREHWLCGKLLLALGDISGANMAFADAAQTMEQEAQHISDAELRSAYLDNHDFNREITATVRNGLPANQSESGQFSQETG